MKCYGGDTAVYLKNRDLQERMRRGLTFIRQNNDLEIGRQGLPKFFDLDILEIFKPDSVCLPASSYPVTIYNLEKLNGENAQISWSRSLQRWLICSKNVALAATDLANAREQYSGKERFTYALHIAGHRFEGTLPNVKELDALKEFLSGNTLVGEVVDLSNAQHVVDNPERIGLIYFAIVSKEPSGKKTPLCVLPNEAIPTFTRHGLKHVNVGERCVLTAREDVPKLQRFVDEICIDKSPHPYICSSEGSVMYATGDRTGRVLFLAKVKTTKYRVLSRLRELMKRASNCNCDPGSAEGSKMRKGFKQDIQKWGLEEGVYLGLFDVANRTRSEGNWDQKRLSNWYIEFLRECINKCESLPNVEAPVIQSGDFNHESELESSADEDDNFAKNESNVTKPTRKNRMYHRK
jgi:hypothetical protein